MDFAYLHIVANHIPIIGIPFALALLLLGLWRKSDELKAAALLLFVLVGIAAVGVFLLGQAGEDFVEGLAGISEDAIEAHEEIALVSLISVCITALLSLIGLIFYRGFGLLTRRSSLKPSDGTAEENTKPLFPLVPILAILGLALISAGLLGYTGKLGGMIRHSEFYGGGQGVQPNSENSGTNDREAQEGDEGGKGRGRNRGKE